MKDESPYVDTPRRLTQPSAFILQPFVFPPPSPICRARLVEGSDPADGDEEESEGRKGADRGREILRGAGTFAPQCCRPFGAGDRECEAPY